MEALRQALSQAFEDRHVEYQFANEFHKYRVEWGPTHWLYVAHTFVDDHTETRTAEWLGWLSRTRSLRTSQPSRWLFLGERGVCEVDDAFGRGRP